MSEKLEFVDTDGTQYSFDLYYSALGNLCVEIYSSSRGLIIRRIEDKRVGWYVQDSNHLFAAAMDFIERVLKLLAFL